MLIVIINFLQLHNIAQRTIHQLVYNGYLCMLTIYESYINSSVSTQSCQGLSVQCLMEHHSFPYFPYMTVGTLH